jgi:hypothetical protein
MNRSRSGSLGVRLRGFQFLDNDETLGADNCLALLTSLSSFGEGKAGSARQNSDLERRQRKHARR